jgi:hypothetical protein
MPVLLPPASLLSSREQYTKEYTNGHAVEDEDEEVTEDGRLIEGRESSEKME